MLKRELPCILNSERELPCILNSDGITIKEWENVRRKEIISIFEQEVFGKVPVETPDKLSFEIVSSEDFGEIGLKKNILVHITKSFQIPATLIIPKNNKKPCPIFLTMILENYQKEVKIGESIEFLPVEYILKNNYALMYFFTSDVDPDFDDNFKNGVHGIFDKIRDESSWGTIAAWAWAARKMVDYIETDNDLDSSKVILVGHSRCGKTALWAGALDERICMVVSNNSGSTGAAISRGKRGETVKAINTGFPHWFCENYKKYNDNEEKMPFDQHMLLALIAPRHLYVTSADEDIWADPNAEFEACIYALDAYSLYSLARAETSVPDLPQYYHNGRLMYHLRKGKHGLFKYDWERFIDYADKFII